MAVKKRTGRSPGLTLRDSGYWHIDIVYRGRRICESTRTRDHSDAEEYLAHRKERVRREEEYGERPKRTFRDGALQYLNTAAKKSMRDDIRYIEFWLPLIGKTRLDLIHDGTLEKGKKQLMARGLSRATLNHYLEIVRHILLLAQDEWCDEATGQTWLLKARKINMLPKTAHVTNADIRPPRLPHFLSWDEQERLLRELPPHLKGVCEFATLTGMREGEMVALEWAWVHYDGPNGWPYIVLPDVLTKSMRREVVVLSARARELLAEQEGRHATRVWTTWLPHARKPVYKTTTRFHNSAWRKAWKRAGLPSDPQVLQGIHTTRHTFATRLREQGIGRETRKLLLRHADDDLTTRYSHAQWNELLTAVERIATRPTDGAALSIAGDASIFRRQA